MILDYLEHADKYNGILADYKKTMDFALTLKDSPTGRYECGNSYVMVQEMETKLPKDKEYELHRKYADVHIVLEGEEVFGYEEISKLSPSGDYNPEKDMQFLGGVGQFVTLTPGMFLVTLPQDGHKPGCCAKSPSKLRKLVVKIPV
ncbi:MAG: YhcH/YjgK/YiaL family protein [Eubacteriales bacterium]